MSRSVITLIILLTAVSLIAALATQLFWVRDAVSLKEDQFNNSVKIALKSIVNTLMTSDVYYPVNIDSFDSAFLNEHQDIIYEVNPNVLDSLIHEEFTSMQILDDFSYGVYRELDQTFVMGDFSDFEKQIVESPHQVSLTCLCQSENYLLSVFYPQQRSMILNQMMILPVMSGLFLAVLIFSFFFTIYFIIRQKKLSEMKTDFVNNMTHEFKTPISTISVSSEMLSKKEVNSVSERVIQYAKIIFDENTRLKNLVEKVLQIAILDKDDFKLKLKEVDVHQLLKSSIDSFNVQMVEKSGTLIEHLDAQQCLIKADPEHLMNVFINLLDNATKYSPEDPEIIVSTKCNDGKIQIDFEDKGIGISSENQKHIFKKFHRLQSGDIHDVKGFGIGLFYVKTMIENMDGTINVDSELNKGSKFSIAFPL